MAYITEGQLCEVKTEHDLSTGYRDQTLYDIQYTYTCEGQSKK